VRVSSFAYELPRACSASSERRPPDVLLDYPHSEAPPARRGLPPRQVRAAPETRRILPDNAAFLLRKGEAAPADLRPARRRLRRERWRKNARISSPPARRLAGAVDQVELHDAVGFFIGASGWRESGSTRPTKRSPSARGRLEARGPAEGIALEAVGEHREVLASSRCFTARARRGRCADLRPEHRQRGCESTGEIAGSSIIESAKSREAHAIAPTPRPPQSGWAWAASARSQR